MDKIKEYLIEVVIKKMGPSFVKGAIAWLCVYLGAHQGLLNSVGITYDAAGHDLNIDLDALGMWAFTIGSGAIMAMLTAAQHHASTAIQGDQK